jgi:hypothetical protein
MVTAMVLSAVLDIEHIQEDFALEDLPVDGRKTILHWTLIVSSSQCRFGSWKT